jgi:hypothetical protein
MADSTYVRGDFTEIQKAREMLSLVYLCMYLFIYHSFKDAVINRDYIALNNLIIF